ncbi:MAG: NAD-dependent epimerase/dehydratase family protein [Bacteroidetes bacterium]|nr:NAD-dependent epimerase/dehydratase family protein [Bacteroidota bacterium]
MKAIIFGSNGQDGYYLSKLLQKLGLEVFNISRSKGHIIGDVANFSFVSDIIKEKKPEYIFSFAANSTTNHNALFENHQTISTGTINILESVRIHSPDTRVFISGSAMQFKNIGQPINEITPFEASSPYSIARIQSVYAARYYKERFSMKIYIGYFFNHDSPLRSERHINQRIVSTARRINQGSKEKLLIGDLSVRKEFAFAGDIIKGVWTLVNQDNISEAVIGSGVDYSIQDWVEICFKEFNLNWEEHIVIDKTFNSEYSRLVSNPSIINGMNWKCLISINDLAKLMIQNPINS